MQGSSFHQHPERAGRPCHELMWPALVILLIIRSLACADPLPGTQPLTVQGDLAAQMVDGIDRFLLAQTQRAMEQRESFWKRDVTSPEKYEASVAPNRARLAKMLGVVDRREPFEAPELIATTHRSALVGTGAGFEAYAVRWPAVRGIYGEGLLLVPANGKAPVADVIALADADQSPEMITGLIPGVAPESQFARRLAESGCRVLVPTLIDRSDTFSLPPSGQRTNQPHREYIYRPAFEMGRHVIGYEIQKVLAGVDWMSREDKGSGRKIGVMGYGEGGMLALYAAALDSRISAACVCGYVDARENLWQEAIYRNVFGLLREFNDADIATLVAPRKLIVEACRGPVVDGPSPPHDNRKGAAPGKLRSPSLSDVRREVRRANELMLAEPAAVKLIPSGSDGQGACGSSAAMESLLSSLGSLALAPAAPAPHMLWPDLDPNPRMMRQVEEMQDFTAALVRGSEKVRKAYWAKADPSSLDRYQQSTEPYREAFYRDVIGRFDLELLPPNARTRQVFDEPKYVGYEVMLDVFPDVFASGILLVPKGMKDGERWPVVVCQHGLEGTPRDVADPAIDNKFYHHFACKLAEAGFVTYAPQNPYIGQDRFRVLQRKANPIGRSLYSIIVPQHEQLVRWLGSLPFVDRDRIAFYGLSYGGKTAMRVPALVKGYCLSICSGDFNEWVVKTTSLTLASGYPGSGEYEMFEWDLGETFNYAEMAALIAPRPFMVERGHRDGVGTDELVSYEYAKVRRLYADLKIPDRTRIEYFDGPHTIHGVGTFEFLREQLKR